MRNIFVGLSIGTCAASAIGCLRADERQVEKSGTAPAQAVSAPPAATASATAKPSAPAASLFRRSYAYPTINEEDLARELAAKLEVDVDPASGDLELMWVQGKWAYWRRLALREITEGSRIRFYFQKYYLQRIGEPRAKFAEKYVDRYRGPDEEGERMAVLDDGTVIEFNENWKLQWISPDGTKTTVDDPGSGHFVRIDSVGALWQTKATYGKGGDAGYAYRFIPFAGKSLAVEKAVEVSPSGVEYLRREHPVRHKNEFAWTDGWTIRFVDVKTGKRRSLDLQGPAELHASHYLLRHFDDRVIACALNCFDAATGEMFTTQSTKAEERLAKGLVAVNDGSERRAMGIFALHDGIGYYFDLKNQHNDRFSRRILTADPRAKTFELVELAAEAHRVVGQDDAGLVLWTGTAWQHVPWVKEK